MTPCIVVILATVVIVVSGVPVLQQDTNSTKYDAVNVDQIIQNRPLLKQYVNCFLTDAECTPHAAELRGVLPEVLINNCALCTFVQRATVEKLFTFIYSTQKDVFEKLVEKYSRFTG